MGGKMTTLTIVMRDFKPIFQHRSEFGRSFSVSDWELKKEDDTVYLVFKKRYKGEDGATHNEEILLNVYEDIELLSVDGVVIYPKSEMEV